MSDDPRLSVLIKQGKTGEIVLVGYPFQHASLRVRRKGGEENGPCCLRRFYGKVGPLVNSEYQIDISNINLTDYGNIVGDPKSPSKLTEELKTTIDELLSQSQIPIVFGGSRQTTYATTLSFSQKYPNGRHIYFCGYPSVSRPYDNDKLSSNSLFQVLPSQITDKCIIIGTHDKYWPSTSKFQIKRIDISQIRKTPTPESFPNIHSPRTQMGSLLQTLLSDQSSESIYISISMQVINHFMGTFYKPLQGLSRQQILQVMFLLGTDKRVQCLDLTQFNPANEDYNSSLTILNMVYYFLMGYTLRKKKQKQEQKQKSTNTN